MAFKTSADGTVASASDAYLASKSGIPAMYGSGDFTTTFSNEFISSSLTSPSIFDPRVISVGEGRVVVGDYSDESAKIFDYDGTVIDNDVVATDAVSGDRFGTAVAVGCGRIVIGAPRDDNSGSDSGSVYIFDLDGTQITRFVGSDTTSGDRFGSSVAIGCNRIVVGAPLDDDGASGAGSVYVFEMDGTQLVKINAPDPGLADNFGIEVAIANGIIAIGAYGDDDVYSESGAVYLFTLDGAFIKKIVPPNDTGTTSGSDFGDLNCVAIGDGRIVIGQRNHSDGTRNYSGRVLVYDYSGNLLWTHEDPRGNFMYFGQAVAVGNGRVLVGALDYSQRSSKGSLYIFDLDGNLIEERYTPSAIPGFAYFASALDINDGKIVAGAPFGRIIAIYDTPNVITPYTVDDWERGH